jgi:hypothetical protein
MRTKWDVLVGRRDLLVVALEAANGQLEWMERTTFGRPCAGCGTILATEADFAKHFLIPDERFLNTGTCPRKDRETDLDAIVPFPLPWDEANTR